MCSKYDQLQSNESFEVVLEGNEWELPNNLEVLSFVREEIKLRLKTLNWNEDSVDMLKLAVDEAISNAIIHGNLNLEIKEGESRVSKFYDQIREASKLTQNLNKRVYLEFEADEHSVRVRIRDTGEGFIPDQQEDHELTETHGRGISIMQKTCDKVNFLGNEDGNGNIVELIKYNESKEKST